MPTVIEARPPPVGPSTEFRDNWNYRIEQSKIPLLAKSFRNHTLPPTANETVSRYN